MKKTALLLLVPVMLSALASCDENMTMETDMSEANMATDCPVDVSEADRANYPACN
jgi:hypothetical protein